MPNTLLITQDSLEGDGDDGGGERKRERRANWELLPALILRKILCYFSNPCDVIHASQSCKRWYAMLLEREVWLHLYFCQTGTEFRQTRTDQISSVYDEVVRLYYDSPKIDILVKDAHADEVLHVSFSHTGRYFCTTSKDCSFKVWLVDNPVHPIFSYQMRCQFNWKYTQYSEFNSNDTMLLVSGVNLGQNSNSGHIAVFSVPSFELLSRVPNQPYDVFGCWFSNDTLLSGMLRWGHGWNSTSVIYLNQATQALENASQAVRGPLFRFENHNGSSLRMLRVINFRRPACLDANICTCCDDCQSLSLVLSCDQQQQIGCGQQSGQQQQRLPCGRYLAFTTGSQTFMPHEIALKRVPDSLHDLPPIGGVNWDASSLSGTDLSIDLRGHVVGIAVDPENSAIFLNVRRWPDKTVVTDPFRPPMPSTELEVRVVDLSLGQLLETPIYRGHRAHTGETDCFFIFLDVSVNFVASGAEDSACYVWDRHSAGLLRRIEFANVVNCAAFLPSLITTTWNNSNNNNNNNGGGCAEGGLLVSVSDDRSLKLSFSQRRFNSLPRALRERTVIQSLPDL